jgi:hypothetical protein
MLTILNIFKQNPPIIDYSIFYHTDFNMFAFLFNTQLSLYSQLDQEFSTVSDHPPCTSEDPTVNDLWKLLQIKSFRWSQSSSAKPGDFFTTEFMDMAQTADDLFYIVHQDQLKVQAECPDGFSFILVLRSIPFLYRDKEGWAGRFLDSFRNVVIYYGGIDMLIGGGYPVFKLLDSLSRLKPYSNLFLFEFVHELYHNSTFPNFATTKELVYVSMVWGDKNSKLIPRWIELWTKGDKHTVILYCLDQVNFQACKNSWDFCVDASNYPKHPITKHKILEETLVNVHSSFVAWIDFDVIPVREVKYLTKHLLELDKNVNLYLPVGYIMDHLQSWLLLFNAGIAETREQSIKFLDQVIEWFFLNPWSTENPGSFWDSILGHKSKDVFIKTYSDGAPVSFWPKKQHLPPLNYQTLDEHAFASTEGFTKISRVLVFHLAEVDDQTSFDCWKTSNILECINPYQKIIKAPLPTAVDLQFHAVSYASGCCKESQKLNSLTAKDKALFDKVFAYNETALSFDFRSRNFHILSNPRGAGYWLWKPYVILQTLLSHEVSEGDVVIYLDAGNHYLDKNIRDLVKEILKETDVTAGYLKCCVDADWCKRDTLILGGVDELKSIKDSAQLEAYFLVFRKSEISIKFVTHWLQMCEDARALTDSENELGYGNYPFFNRHIHDQSIFSILFKKHGFKGFDLDLVLDRYIKLARWRN